VSNWSLNDLPKGLRAQAEQKLTRSTTGADAPAGPGKYKAMPTIVGDIRFDSLAEAKYYEALLLRVAAGEVLYFLRQVPIHLPGRVRLVVDFLEFHVDGSIHYVDVKGYATDQFKAKKKIAESLYPIEIEVVR